MCTVFSLLLVVCVCTLAEVLEAEIAIFLEMTGTLRGVNSLMISSGVIVRATGEASDDGATGFAGTNVHGKVR